MSCHSCNCDPCRCVPAAGCCPETETLTYTFENQNLIGIGVFDNETDRLVGFRGIVSLTNSIIVALDAANNAITLDFDIDVFVADLPDATTAQRGVLETATDAEAIAKAATDKILTPSNLAALGSSATFAGLIEIATNAEAIAGASSTLAIVPSSLAAVVATLEQTTTFADAVARAAAVPAFEGQFGYQLDTDTAWVADGAGAGAWRPLFTLESANVATGNTSLDLPGGIALVISCSDLSSSTIDFNGLVITLDANSELSTAGLLNIAGTLEIAGAPVPAASVLVTVGAATPGSRLLNTFISTANVQTGWGTPSGTLDRTTFASYTSPAITNPPTQAEVQAIADALQDVSRGLAALITDLKAILLPAT